MSQSPNPGGRPAIGPTVPPFAVPAELLAAIDADVARRGTSRAQWLRAAAAAALPYDVLRGGRAQEVLRELDGQLDARRVWALDAEQPREERQVQGVMYGALVHELRVLIRRLRDALPVQEARDAYKPFADSPGAEDSPEGGEAWGKVVAAETLDQLLDAVSLMLPLDDTDVSKRAGWEDPREIL